MWNKIILSLIIALFIALLGFIAFIAMVNHNLSRENAKLKAELANINTLVDLQNKQILQDKLDLESYKSAKPQIQEKIITRYVNLGNTQGATQCEKDLNTIKQALRAFYER